jgi:hypothetical protein
MPIIKSFPLSKEIDGIINPPQAAQNFIPDWYKSLDTHIYGETKTTVHPNILSESNFTVKGCSSFFDALTHGYIYTLPADIQFKGLPNGKLKIEMNVDESFIIKMVDGPVDKSITNSLPVGKEFYEHLLMWNFDFSLKTPKGYSVLFCHPLNRFELPFQTFSGVVETDEYSQSVHFPFYIKKIDDGEIIMLKKGTPIVQIMPFKREHWKIENKPFSQKLYDFVVKQNFQLKSIIGRSYKIQWWKRKKYE